MFTSILVFVFFFIAINTYTLIADAVCTIACLPQNYTQSEQNLMRLLNRTWLPSD